MISDELEMDAIDQRYGVGRAAVLAVQAGVDLVLVPWRLEKKLEVWDALLKAVRQGEITQARLDASVRRVLAALKARRGLFNPLPPRGERLAALGDQRALAEQIAQAGLTLLRVAPGFPLRPHQRVLVITPEASLAEALQRHLKIQPWVVPAFPKAQERDALKRETLARARASEVVVVAVTNSNWSW